MITENVQYSFEAPAVLDFELMEDDPVAHDVRGLDDALGSLVIANTVD